ncbi:MAG: methyltransferase domain-containing protein [Vulcanimicrobiota bacterium]
MAWNERYLAEDTPWDRGGPTLALSHWLASVEQTLRVAVPGCGRGHDVVELARQGHQVVALDIAPVALDQLRQRLEAEELQALVELADVLVWQPETRLDAVYEQTCLCALGPEHWVTYAHQLHSWLKPGGTLAVSFMHTHRDGGPPWHCPIDRMRELFPASRWSWPHHGGLRIPHREGLYELAYQLERL